MLEGSIKGVHVMRFVIYLLGLLALLPLAPHPAYAQKELTLEQKSKIIEKLPSPRVSWEGSFNVSVRGLTLSTEEKEASTRLLIRLRKPIPKDPLLRAEHLLSLSEDYKEVENPKAALKAAKDAETILSTQKLPSAKEKNRILLLLADTRQYQDDPLGAEKLSREAVRLYPQEWSAWRYLASRLYDRSINEMLDGPSSTLESPSSVVSRLEKEIVPADKLERSQKVFAEADACLVKAESLSPKEPTIILTHLVRELYVAVRNVATQKATGKTPDTGLIMREAVLGSEAIAWMRKLAEVQPNDPLAVGGYAFFSMLRSQIDRSATSLTADDRKRLSHTITRLEKLGSDTKRDALTRARAWEIAGMFSVAYLDDYTSGIRYFREERAIDANRSGGWLGGIASAALLKNYEETYQLAQEYVKRRDTTMTRLLLAKGAIESGRLSEAEQILRALREKEPTNIKVDIALGVTLIKRSEGDPTRLQEIYMLIENLVKQSANNLEKDDFLDLSMLAAVAAALLGNVENGIELLETASKQDADNESVRELLAILEGRQ